jgi:hypothetical protein
MNGQLCATESTQSLLEDEMSIDATVEETDQFESRWSVLTL